MQWLIYIVNCARPFVCFAIQFRKWQLLKWTSISIRTFTSLTRYTMMLEQSTWNVATKILHKCQTCFITECIVLTMDNSMLLSLKRHRSYHIVELVVQVWVKKNVYKFTYDSSLRYVGLGIRNSMVARSTAGQQVERSILHQWHGL